MRTGGDDLLRPHRRAGRARGSGQPECRAGRDPARQPRPRRRHAPDGPLGARRQVRRLHRGGRADAGEAARRRVGPGQPVHEARRGRLAHRRRSPARLDRRPARHRLRGPPVRAGAGREGPGTGAPRQGARGGGLLRDEHHDPVGVGLVGGRRRLPAGLPPHLRAARPPGPPLFRPDLLCLGLVGAAPWPHQHGRADLHRRVARLRPQPLRHAPQRAACLLRRGDVPAVLPAHRPHARPRDARAGALRRGGPGAACPRRCHDPPGRAAALRARVGDRARCGGARRRGRAGPGRRRGRAGNVRTRLLARLGRVRPRTGCPRGQRSRRA